VASGDITSIPQSADAEQALLGCCLYDTSAIGTLPPALEAIHFFEPFHQRLYSRLQLAFQKGRSIDLIGVMEAFKADRALEELGGGRYLAALVDAAPPTPNAKDYAEIIISLAVKRSLLAIVDEVRSRVLKEPETSGEQWVMDTMAALGAVRTSSTDMRLIGADEAVFSVLDYIDNPGGHASGILTGLAPVDDCLGPWLPGDLIVGAGRPGMGKSALAGVIATNVALAGHGVIEINAEMSVGQMWRRRMTAMAFAKYAEQAPAYSKIRKRTIEYREREMLDWAASQLRQLPIKGIRRSGIRLGRVRALLQRQKSAWEREGRNLGLVTIDHVGIIHPDGEYRSRVDEQTAVSGGLKEMADDLGVPILALAQLSRKTEDREDKRPQLADLRDSGSWEQDADVVIGCYREAYYAQREKEPDDSTTKGNIEWGEWSRRKGSPWIEAILLKVREGEPNTAKLWAHMPTNTILGQAADDNLGGLL